MHLDSQRVNHIRSYFEQKPVNKAYLFGSYARGNASYDSDIDILVDLQYDKGIGLEFVQMHLDLEEQLGSKVDLVSTKSLSKHIAPSIDNEKVLIYER